MTELTAKSGRRKARDLYFGLNVLRTELKGDLAALLADISQDIGPTDFIEKLYVNDVVYHTWDIMRFPRAKKTKS